MLKLSSGKLDMDWIIKFLGIFVGLSIYDKLNKWLKNLTIYPCKKLIFLV